MEIIPGYEGLNPYFGDLHNHCNIGYGHGSIEEAFQNARLQLDFACVTAHAYWPDLPTTEKRLAEVVDYHRKGFQRTRQAWPHLQEVVEANNQPGRFVSFLGFEWHSMLEGDHHICFKGSQGEIIPATDLVDLRERLRQLGEQGVQAFAFAHHIGYKTGYRGINWERFDPEFTPAVEIMSMHGASESDEAPYPYLHTMGPRDWRSTLQYGLSKGNIVGVVGSTDHHSAHPGSYGHGRMGVWAKALTREDIWEAIKARRTYALTGDRITLAFSINNLPMGSLLPASPERKIEVFVEGGDAMDNLELVYNNHVLKRWDQFDFNEDSKKPAGPEPVKVYLEVGWGEKGQITEWQVQVDVIAGQLLDIEPRFRGQEVVAPQSYEEDTYAFSHWERTGDNGLFFSTRTWGNPTTTTASTQGVSLKIMGNEDTRMKCLINGKEIDLSLADLLQGSRAGYLGGFLTPAYRFHRAIPQREYGGRVSLEHSVESHIRDWYYVRVRQRNGQFAWSSPIWLEAIPG